MHYPSIFISDIHLGTKGSQDKLLLDFLKQNSCDKLYLVGDIVDGWRLAKKWYWPTSHNTLIRHIITKAKQGTKVYWVVGNHDEMLRKFLDFNPKFGRIKIVDEIVHLGIDGKKYLITHGDKFDGITQMAKWLVLVCVARVSSEKNLKAFFDLEIAAKKIMVGVGPDLEKYQKAYPQVEFVGLKKGQELAKYYQNADCFVFPSLTDTFGVVLLEAIACGTPVAAYPTTGPIDIINNGENGYLDNDLLIATQKALTVDRKSTYESSKIWSWQLCYGQFMHSLVKAS
jgi:UDP-2,3-diacylglucosamine pyrophosphatase LpxH